MKKVKVINCKSLGIRSTPEDPERCEDIIATISAGEEVEVDPFDYCYDWTGRRFYKIKTASGLEGWAYYGCLSKMSDVVTHGIGVMLNGCTKD